MFELQRGNVDADVNLFGVRGSPVREVSAGLFDHPVSELMNQASLLGDLNELAGGNIAELSVRPSRESSNPQQPPCSGRRWAGK